MHLTEDEKKAIKILLHGEYKIEFRRFMSALAKYAETLNEALIYGNGKDMSLDCKQGMTRSIVEVIKAIETASSYTIVEEKEDTRDGPTSSN